MARLPSTHGQLRGNNNNEIDEALLQEKLQELKLNFGFKVPIFSGEREGAGWPQHERHTTAVGGIDDYGASSSAQRDLSSGYTFTNCTGALAGPKCGEVIANYSAGETQFHLPCEILLCRNNICVPHNLCIFIICVMLYTEDVKRIVDTILSTLINQPGCAGTPCNAQGCAPNPFFFGSCFLPICPDQCYGLSDLSTT